MGRPKEGRRGRLPTRTTPGFVKSSTVTTMGFFRRPADPHQPLVVMPTSFTVGWASYIEGHCLAAQFREPRDEGQIYSRLTRRQAFCAILCLPPGEPQDRRCQQASRGL
jgi:hypothetical protein